MNKEIRTCATLSEGHALRSFLEAHDIPASVSSMQLGSFTGGADLLPISGGCIVSVVREEDLERARALAEEFGIEGADAIEALGVVDDPEDDADELVEDDGDVDDRTPPLEGVARREAWVEMAVVLVVALFGSAVATAMALFEPEQVPVYGPQVAPVVQEDSSATESMWWLVNELPAIALVLFLMWRSPGGWRLFGLKRVEPLGDTLLGGALLVIAYGSLFTVHMVSSILSVLTSGSAVTYGDETSVAMGPVDHGPALLVAVSSVVPALTEELVFRAYLITRLEQLWVSRVAIVAAPAAVFAALHAGYGSAHVAATFVFGLIYGGLFCYMRRIWPLVIGHAAYNAWVFWG